MVVLDERVGNSGVEERAGAKGLTEESPRIAMDSWDDEKNLGDGK